MSDGAYHHSPELLNQLNEAIWRLVRSKEKLLYFFESSGVDRVILNPFARMLEEDGDSFKMPVVSRKILERLNATGDAGLAARRQVLRRVVEWEDFSSCWPNLRDDAELYVRRVRELTAKTDSFTRRSADLERELDRQRAEKRAEQAKREAEELAAQSLQRRLAALPATVDPARRGREFEEVLNDLFEKQNVRVRDSFRIVDDGITQEQIDGVVLVDNGVYLVEVKWTREARGVDVVGQHMMRLMAREGALGLYISRAGFTGPAIAAMRETLAIRTTICADWHEIIFAMEIGYPLRSWIREKRVAAIAEKNIYYRLGVDFEQPGAR